MKQTYVPEIRKYVKNIDEIYSPPLVKAALKKWLPKAKDILTETQSTIERLPSFECVQKDIQRSQTKEDIDKFFSQLFRSIERN
jgi:hypothetical protein